MHQEPEEKYERLQGYITLAIVVVIGVLLANSCKSSGKQAHLNAYLDCFSALRKEGSSLEEASRRCDPIEKERKKNETLVKPVTSHTP